MARLPTVEDINLNKTVDKLVNENLCLTGIIVKCVKHLNKQPSQRSVLLVELDTRAHRSDVLRKKQLLREKYTTPIYIHAAKSQTELKMERNTKSLLNMIPDALRTHKVTYDGHIRELQHIQYNPYRPQNNTTHTIFNQTSIRVNHKSQNNYRYDRRASSEHKQQPQPATFSTTTSST